jgi:hypothetical protein
VLVNDGGPEPPVDLLDLVMEYRRVFGAHPATWRDFVSGLDHINRNLARTSLQLATAAGMAAATKESAEPWYERQKIAAGWVTHG